MAYTKLIRDLLFVETPSGFQDEKRALLGNHFQLRWNASDILKNNWFTMDLLHTAIVTAAFLWLFNETRVLLSLLPLFIFLWLSDRRYRVDLRT